MSISGRHDPLDGLPARPHFTWVLDRVGGTAVIDRVRCDELFRTDLAASCEYLHGTTQNWRTRECESTANAYYAVARSFGRTYYTGTGDPS